MKYAKQILIALAGVAFIVTSALSETQRARLGDLGRNSMVVTNVTESGGAPGNWEVVSNAAMSAAAQTNEFLRLDGTREMSGDIRLGGASTIYFSGVWGVRLYAGWGEEGQRIYTNDGVDYTTERGLAWKDEVSPSAPEVTTALRWRADGTACVVTVAAGGTLSADTTEWTEGQAVMAIITLAEGAGVASDIELVGYGTWPTGTAFVACCYRVGLTVYVVPSTTL